MGLNLVTGGAGFIGRWVVGELLKRGKRVIVLDNLSSGRRENLEEFAGCPGYEGLIRGDIRQFWTLYELFFRGLEACFHLAAKVDVRPSVAAPMETFECNVSGTMRLLEMCREYDTRMVFVSTCHVYDHSDDPIAEENPTTPRSPYAACKLAAENLCLGYHHAYQLPTVILRPFNTYGPFQRQDGEGGVVARFLQRALDGDELVLHGNGEQTRDLMYVEDCARFVVDAGLAPECDGRVLNAATGVDVSMAALAQLIIASPGSIRSVKHPHPESETARMVGDSGRAGRMLGWRPTVALDEGLMRTRAWLGMPQSPAER